MMDDYSVIVVFRRSHGMDDEIAAEKGISLSQQLADELQEACDNGMGGDFQVLSLLEDDGLTFKDAVTAVRKRYGLDGHNDLVGDELI